MTETMSQPVSERHLSIARCTLQAITLPFARADRLVLAGLPFLALCGIGWLWNGNLFYDFVKPISLVTLTVPALQEFGRAARSMSGIDGIAWFISLTTLAFWLCAWQRAIATGFREPLADWLIASLRRMPQYLAMFGAWAIVGFVVFALSNALYSENLWLSHFPVIDPNGLPRARAPLTISVGLLASLFVYVRLAPLTALAAWDGRGSPRDAARIPWPTAINMHVRLAQEVPYADATTCDRPSGRHVRRVGPGARRGQVDL